MVDQDNNSDARLFNYFDNYSFLTTINNYFYTLLINNQLTFKVMQDNNFDRAQENKAYSRLVNEYLTVTVLDVNNNCPLSGSWRICFIDVLQQSYEYIKI